MSFFSTLLAFLVSLAAAAHEPAVAGNAVELPAQCLARKTFPCAVHFTIGGRYQVGGREIAVSARTDILLRSEGWELLNGHLWSSDWSQTTLKHGLLTAALDGEVLLHKASDQLFIFNLNGSVQVEKGKKASEPVPAGFQNWYRGVQRDGEWAQGMIEPLRENFLSELEQVVRPAPRVNWSERIPVYRENRALAIEESSRLYRAIAVQRRLASEEIERQKARALARQREERRKFRKMMHDRLFNP